MKKNVGNHEANIRMVAGALIVLFALFVVEVPVIKIFLATLAAILAGTAFIHYCPVNALLKKDTSEKGSEESNEEDDSTSNEETGEEDSEKGSE